MDRKESQETKQEEQLKNLEPKADQVKGGKHPAKVTVPDIKVG
jgi:hypothetical protein